MDKNTKEVLRSIQSYVTLTILLTAIIVTIISIYPLYNKLESIEEKNVAYTRDASVFIIDQYLLRLKDIAKQVSSRTRANELLNQYVNGKIQLHPLKQELNTLLINALRGSTHIIGITRLDNKGKPVASIGKSIPIKLWPKTYNEESQIITGPIEEDSHFYIAISSPIYFKKFNEIIGTDITLFDITDLHTKLSHNKNQQQLGETLIGYKKGNEIHILFKDHTEWGKFVEVGNGLYKAIFNATIHHKTDLTSANINDQTIIIAHAPINQSTWSVAVIVKKIELIAAIKRTLWSILTVITIIIIFFITGLEFLLKPISNKILIAQQDLEDRIEKSQFALQKANKKLRELAERDFLTNTLNRRGFQNAIERELSRAKRNEQSFSLLYIDVNGFKKINDQYGHQSGDIILKTLTERIMAITRKEDSVARIGGDEFAIITSSSSTSTPSESLITKIKAATKTPIQIKNELLTCHISIGSATYPKDGNTVDALMHHADSEMYRDKMRYKRES